MHLLMRMDRTQEQLERKLKEGGYPQEVTEQAIDYVWEQFTTWAFTPQLTAYARERSAILRDMQHRPINPNSEAHQQFLQRLAEKKRKFEAKWGSID